jgi:DNA-binding MarR family transcriptional regulator
MNERARVDRDDLGFLLAKASQRWNELLAEGFAACGHGEVRPSAGSVLLPLYEEDGLRMGELAARARVSKQTMTQMIAGLERDGLVERRVDPSDGRAALISLTRRAHRFEPVAAGILIELDRLARRRVGARRVAELKNTLREVMEIDAGRGAARRVRSSGGRVGDVSETLAQVEALARGRGARVQL